MLRPSLLSLLVVVGLGPPAHALDVTLSPTGGNRTAAIQGAIDQVAAGGGGTVYLKRGNYWSGAVWLKSNVYLNLQAGAYWSGASDWTLYTRTWNWRIALINLSNVSNCGVTGSGTIDGVWVQGPAGQGEGGSEWGGVRGPHLVSMSWVSNVTFSGVTFKNAGNYHNFAQDCYSVTFSGCKFQNGYDGIHSRYGHNYLIQNCTFATGDDAIAGWVNENFVVRTSTIGSATNAFRIGCQNLEVDRCAFKGWAAKGQRYKSPTTLLMDHCFQHLSPYGENWRPANWGPYDSFNWNIHDCTCDEVKEFFKHFYRYSEAAGEPPTHDWDYVLPMGADASGRGVTIYNCTVTKMYNGLVAVGPNWPNAAPLCMWLGGNTFNTFHNASYSYDSWAAYAVHLSNGYYLGLGTNTFTNSTGNANRPAVAWANVVWHP